MALENWLGFASLPQLTPNRKVLKSPRMKNETINIAELPSGS